MSIPSNVSSLGAGGAQAQPATSRDPDFSGNTLAGLSPAQKAALRQELVQILGHHVPLTTANVEAAEKDLEQSISARMGGQPLLSSGSLAYMSHEEVFLQSLQSLWNTSGGDLSACYTLEYPTLQNGSCEMVKGTMDMKSWLNQADSGLGDQAASGSVDPAVVGTMLDARHEQIGSHVAAFHSIRQQAAELRRMASYVTPADSDFGSMGSVASMLNSLVLGSNGVLAVSQSQVTTYYNSLLYNEAQESALNSAEGLLASDPKGTLLASFDYPVWSSGTFTMASTVAVLSSFMSQEFNVTLVSSGSASICLSDNMQQVQMAENLMQNSVQNNQTFLSSAVNQVQSTCSLLQQIIASIQQLNSQMTQNIR